MLCLWECQLTSESLGISALELPQRSGTMTFTATTLQRYAGETRSSPKDQVLTRQLNFHPTNGHILLSGSTDGIVNVCDTRIADEDDVVIQAFNHGASIHHAGFLNETEVFALSHDEKLALYDLSEDREAGSATKNFGDIREAVSCQYVANMKPKAGQAGAILGAGSQEYVYFRPSA